MTLVALAALLWGVTGEAPATGTSSGLLWGRLAVEEESPDGPWTPLPGVDVIAYPFAPEVLADLELIRRSARDSWARFETAVARVRARLESHAARLGADGDVEGGGVRRAVTDAGGLFVFEDLPAGEWLVVALRVTAYPAGAEDRDHQARRERGFVPRSRPSPAQEAQLWVTRVRLAPGARARLVLTDRARWMVGPLR